MTAGDLTCGRCGKPTHGEASIDGTYYCHQDGGVTCYMQATWGWGNWPTPPEKEE